MDPVSFSVESVGRSSLLIKRGAERKQEILSEKTLYEQRDVQEKLYERIPVPVGVELLETCAGEIPCEWLWRPECHSEKVLLCIHGGGWTSGSLVTARSTGGLLATTMPYKVLTVDYRLAPEHPFPAGLEDCHAAYLWLLSQGFRAENIALIGDSAGGNLCLALIELLLSREEALPCAVVGISPVTDLSQTSELIRRPMPLAHAVWEGERRTIFSLYMEEDPENPLISPIYGRLGEFPPMLLHVGGDEALAVDCAAFAKKADAAGAEIHCKIWREMFHDFSIVGPTLRESRKSLEEIALFLEKHLGRGASPRHPAEQ